jgi:hypothetical protein
MPWSAFCAFFSDILAVTRRGEIAGMLGIDDLLLNIPTWQSDKLGAPCCQSSRRMALFAWITRSNFIRIPMNRLSALRGEKNGHGSYSRDQPEYS